MLGLEPIPVPLPFAAMLNTHLTARPNLGTAGGGGPANPWLSPGVSAGHHLTAQRIMRLRMLGINLAGHATPRYRPWLARCHRLWSPNHSVTPLTVGQLRANAVLK